LILLRHLVAGVVPHAVSDGNGLESRHERH
jgi:hypothetical protein